MFPWRFDSTPVALLGPENLLMGFDRCAHTLIALATDAVLVAPLNLTTGSQMVPSTTRVLGDRRLAINILTSLAGSLLGASVTPLHAEGIAEMVNVSRRCRSARL